jgi:hypothetical protein
MTGAEKILTAWCFRRFLHESVKARKTVEM